MLLLTEVGKAAAKAYRRRVASTTHIILAAAHTEEDIDRTVEAYEKAFQ